MELYNVHSFLLSCVISLPLHWTVSFNQETCSSVSLKTTLYPTSLPYLYLHFSVVIQNQTSQRSCLLVLPLLHLLFTTVHTHTPLKCFCCFYEPVVVTVSYGCCIKVAEWLTTIETWTFLKFWRIAVQNQGVIMAMFLLKALWKNPCFPLLSSWW